MLSSETGRRDSGDAVNRSEIKSTRILLVLAATVWVMLMAPAHIWMGHATWTAASRSGSLDLTDPSQMRRALPRWLKLNPFVYVSRIESG